MFLRFTNIWYSATHFGAVARYLCPTNNLLPAMKVSTIKPLNEVEGNAAPGSDPLSIKVQAMNVFDDRSTFISCYRVFYSYFGMIPSIKYMHGADHKKLIAWVESTYKGRITARHTKEKFDKRSGKVIPINFIYLFNDGLLLDTEDDGSVAVLFSGEKEQAAQELCTHLRQFCKRRNTTHDVSVLIDDGMGFRCVDIRNKKPKLSLELNYNDDLAPLHREIVKQLNKKEGSGLVLFHGTPGTGKSTYIRFLVHCVRKRVIFLPSRVAGNLDSPSMMGFLIDNKDSILVIEDAEDLIKSRDSHNESGISMLLNLTDGILGESLGIQVICTFNTKISNVDSALLRKGRLIAAYEFNALDPMKSGRLLEKLGVADYPVSGAMTLAEIYNTRENFTNNLVEAKRPIGFQVGQDAAA